jgi:hypothetical protein
MCTNTTRAKIVAVTIPFVACKFYDMGIIFTVNFDSESFKVEAMRFLCVSLGFVNLADHSRVHIQSPCLEDGERHAKKPRAFQENNRKLKKTLA